MTWDSFPRCNEFGLRLPFRLDKLESECNICQVIHEILMSLVDKSPGFLACPAEACPFAITNALLRVVEYHSK